MREVGLADRGFYPIECDESGPFRWTRGTFALQPARPARYARLRLGYLAPSGKLTLRAAGRVLDEVQLGQGWNDYVVKLAETDATAIEAAVNPLSDEGGEAPERGVMLRNVDLCDDQPLVIPNGSAARDGFYPAERDHEDEFRWTRATFVLRPAHPARYAQLRLCYLGSAGRLTLKCRGQVLDEVALSCGWHDYLVRLGQSAGAPVSATVRPLVPAAGDSRELGVMLRQGTLFEDQPLFTAAHTAAQDGYYPVEHDDEGPFRWTQETFLIRPVYPARYAQLRLGYLGHSGRLRLTVGGVLADEVPLQQGWRDYIVSLGGAAGEPVSATVIPLVPVGGDSRRLGVMLRRGLLFNDEPATGTEQSAGAAVAIPGQATERPASRLRRLLRSPQRSWQFHALRGALGYKASHLCGRVRGSYVWQKAITHVGRMLGRTAVDNFIILAAPRSGTTAFVDYLNCHPRIRCRGEILNDDYLCYGQPRNMDTARLKLHVESFFVKPAGMLAGAKFLTYQFDEMQIRLADVLQTLHRPRVIVLYRQQILDQFASLKLAERTGIWHSNKPVQGKSIWLDPQEFAGFAERERRMWRDNLAALEHSDVHFVTCEQLHAQPLETMRGVFVFLGVPSCPVEAFVAKLHDRPLAEKVANYRDFLRPGGNASLLLQLALPTAAEERRAA